MWRTDSDDDQNQHIADLEQEKCRVMCLPEGGAVVFLYRLCWRHQIFTPLFCSDLKCVFYLHQVNVPINVITRSDQNLTHVVETTDFVTTLYVNAVLQHFCI